MRTRFIFLLLTTVTVCLLILPASAQDAMTDIETSIHRFIEEAFNQGNVDVLDEVCAPDYIAHPGETDCEAFKQEILSFRAAMPDLQAHIEHLIVEGDTAAFVFAMHGTFENELGSGEMALPPTGNPVEIRGGVMLRFNDAGQMVEEWDVFDNLAIGMQLGMIPMPEGDTMPTEDAMSEEEPMMDEDIQPSGNEETNRATVLQFFESNSGEDLNATDALVAEGFIQHEPSASYDLAGLKEGLTGLRMALPDFRFEVERQVAEGNWVATLFNLRGTFTGEMMNPDGSTLPGNNNEIDDASLQFTRLDDEGKIVETWVFYDQLAFLQGMGIIPAMDAM